MSRILFVMVEPPWPANHGGRIRAARVAEALADRHDVVVAFPDHGARAEDPPVPTVALPYAPPAALRSRAALRPHVGGHFLGPAAAQLLVETARRHRADLVYWATSYLAASAPPGMPDVAQVVEFANIESHRLRTLAGSAGALRRPGRVLEAWKSSYWEPRVAARAALCVAINEPDAATLRQWSSRVLVVPNGVDTVPYRPSPDRGYVLALASYEYEPNVRAVQHLLGTVWPAVHRADPAARLVIAGRRSDTLAAAAAAVPGVEVWGALDSVAPAYEGAAMTVALADSGGGSQLKVTESLARGRCVVMNEFSATGTPQAVRDSAACVVGTDDDALVAHILGLLADPGDRRRREAAGWTRCSLLTWAVTVDELSSHLSRLA